MDRRSLLALVALMSCAPARVPTRERAEAAPEAAPEAVPGAAPSTVRGGSARFQGRTAESWAAQLTDRVPQERVRAAYALAELGPAAAGAVPALRTALGDEMPVVRYAAAWALGEIGPAAEPARPELAARADSDRVGDVRWIAAKVLRKLGAPSPTPH